LHEINIEVKIGQLSTDLAISEIQMKNKAKQRFILKSNPRKDPKVPAAGFEPAIRGSTVGYDKYVCI